MTHIISGTALIWIDQWEYQCCGTPISRGDVVDLTVHETESARPWETVMDGRTVLAATHHVAPEDSYHLRVRVDRLVEARAHREPGPDDALYLVADSGEVRDVETMKIWDEDWQPARAGGQPEGWILRATILEELPPRRDDVPYGIDLSPRLVRESDEVFPRLTDWDAGRAQDPGAGPVDGWQLRTPLLAAWQPAVTPPALDEVPGHPCIITWADSTTCRRLFVSRGGLHEPAGVDDTENYVVLPPTEFLGRTRQLLSSDWPGFSPENHVAILGQYAGLFPKGLPPYLQ